jgi:hypothetical protein
MNIGLYDIDGRNFPNLVLMKLSAWHKQNGDSVCLVNNASSFQSYDLAYKAKVFTKYVKEVPLRATEIISGGTGYGLDNKLPESVEFIYPDYSLYNQIDIAFGYLTRGCFRDCGFCVVSKKEGYKSKKVCSLDTFWRGQKNIVIMDANILACPDRYDLLQQLIDSKAYVNFSQGLDIRLVNDKVLSMLGQMRLHRVHFAWDKQDDNIEYKLKWFASRFPGRFARDLFTVYVLVNYDTSFDFDLYRVEMLKLIGYTPFVMVFKDGKKVEKRYKVLSKFVNQPVTFWSYKNFRSYVAEKFGNIRG